MPCASQHYSLANKPYAQMMPFFIFSYEYHLFSKIGNKVHLVTSFIAVPFWKDCQPFQPFNIDASCQQKFHAHMQQ